MLRSVLTPKWLDGHMREIVQGASAAFLLKIAGAFLTFCFYVAVGRLLGPREAGMYFLALTVVTVAAVLGRVGLDGTMLRLIAAHAATSDWSAVQGVYRKGLTVAIAGTVAATVLTAIFAPVCATYIFAAPELSRPIRWMALSIVPAALIVLIARGLLGLKQVRDANLVNDVGVPAIALVAVGLLAPRWGILGAVWAYALANAATAVLGLWRWRKATPHLRGLHGAFETRELFQSSIPLYWVACLQLVMTWTSTLALGMWATPRDVGIFGIANRTATLTSFILLAVNNIAAPKFAALHRAGDLATLGRVARDSARLMALVAAPMLIVCLILPGPVMRIFGADFESGAAVLSILAAGQFVNVVTGSVGFVLIMCGYERMYRNAFVVCAASSIALNGLLIPRFGILGAAIATAGTLALQNLVAAMLVWRKLGVVTIPFLRPRSEVP
jgi:O-antigen/teichoic acid export membrane protein